MAKELLNLAWVEDLLPLEHTRKKMFGGFAYYMDEKLVLLMFESEGQRSYRGQKFNFEIWNGCMFPAEKDVHSAILQIFPFLQAHPVLPKWLYLPLETEDFESLVQSLMKEIRRHNPLFGAVPGSKASRKREVSRGPEKIEKFVRREPQMFRDEPIEVTIQQARKVSDLKNLGPEMEKALHKAGIKTAQQVVKLGWKKVMKKLCEVSPKNNHAIVAYAIIGAIQGKIWNGISENEKAEARQYMKDLREQKAKKKTSKSR